MADLEFSKKFYSSLDKFKLNLESLLSKHKKEEEIEELNIYYDKLLMLKKANMFVPIEKFYEKVTPFAREILIKDETFFLNKTNDVEKDLEGKEIVLLKHIRSVWFDLIDEEKKDIWNFVRIICIYGENANNGCIFKDIITEIKSNK